MDTQEANGGVGAAFWRGVRQGLEKPYTMREFLETLGGLVALLLVFGTVAFLTTKPEPCLYAAANPHFCLNTGTYR